MFKRNRFSIEKFRFLQTSLNQITGSSYESGVEMIVNNADFSNGSLKRESFVRIDKIGSIEKTLIKYKIGSLKQEKFNEILNRVIDFLKN